MYGRLESGKKNPTGDDSINGRLLHEIEALSKALFLNKQQTPSKKALPSAAPPSNRRSMSAGKTHFPEPPKTNPSRAFREIPSQKDKKSSSSIWNWKPFKALSHIRHRRFNCLFSLQVHSIEGLPSEFDGVSLVVHWRRQDGEVETRASRVYNGVAKFEEILTHKCSLYGSGNGPHHPAKYEAKHFLICASVVGNPHLDLGKHHVDLTRLLPLTLEELEDEKSSGKWTTSFKLSGKAKGATLSVSFEFLVFGDDAPELSNPKPNRIGTVKPELNHDRADSRAALRRVGSLPGASRRAHEHSNVPPQSVESVKILHEVMPISMSEVLGSVDLGRALTYWKFDEGEFGGASVDSKLEHEVVFSNDRLKSYSLSESVIDACENDDYDDAEFTVIERGIEIAMKNPVKVEEDNKDADDIPVVENIRVDESGNGDGFTGLEIVKLHQHEAYRSNVEELPPVGCDSNKESLFAEELVMEELDPALCDPSVLKVQGLGSFQSQSENTGHLIHVEVKSNYKKGKVGKSLSLDDATASVASEFLTMLGIEHSPFGLSSDSDPESPRERLLKQFEEDSLAGGSGIFGIDIGKDMGMELVGDSVQFGPDNLSEDFEISSFVHAAEGQHQKAAQATKSKTKAKMLEDAEAEALMREWGLNENLFWSSPPGSADGFGSPIDFPPEEPFDLPRSEGLGPFVERMEDSCDR